MPLLCPRCKNESLQICASVQSGYVNCVDCGYQGVQCPACGNTNDIREFCWSCNAYVGDLTGKIHLASPWQRLLGMLLDRLILVLSLIVGWLIWLVFTSRTAQTPGKRLIYTYIVDFRSGMPVSAFRVWSREVIYVLMLLVFPLGMLDLAVFVFDRNHRSLHDKLIGTAVIWAPEGLPYAEEQQLNIGLRLGDAGQWTRAIQAFNEALALDPEYGDALAYRGFAHAQLQQYDLAKSDMERALELVEDDELINEIRQGLLKLGQVSA